MYLHIPPYTSNKLKQQEQCSGCWSPNKSKNKNNVQDMGPKQVKQTKMFREWGKQQSDKNKGQDMVPHSENNKQSSGYGSQQSQQANHAQDMDRQ